jgi:hypothetical protein
VPQPVLEQGSVGEAGEGVVEALVAEFVLERGALADVAQREHEAPDRGVGEAVLRGALDVAPAPVRVLHACSDRLLPVPIDRRLEEAVEQAPVVRMDDRGDRGLDQRAGLVAEHALDRTGLPADPQVALQDAHHIVGLIGEGSQARRG